MIKGVLFDMDGVLVDTEGLSRRIFVETCAEAGYTLQPEEFVLFLGCTREEDGRILREKFGADFPFDWMYEEYRRRLTVGIRTEPDILKPGFEACMRGLRERGIKIALATSTAREYLERNYLPYIPAMQNAFDATVCGIEAGRGKPFPDIFLEAARRIGMPIEECMGVEDSLKGLKSLTAAGCVRVMIPDLLPCDERVQGLLDYKVENLANLLPLIDRLNGNGRLRG